MPIIAPRIIRNPIDAIVFPNPSLIVLTIIFAGRVANARNSETMKRAINAFNFNLEVRNIMAIILIPTRADFNKILIDQILVTKNEIQM